jgi:acyl carrier protein
MDQNAMVELMKGYFLETREEGEALDDFGNRLPRELLTESMDLVEFVVYLEEKLGIEIKFNEFGDALINKNFAQLADELLARTA